MHHSSYYDSIAEFLVRIPILKAIGVLFHVVLIAMLSSGHALSVINHCIQLVHINLALIVRYIESLSQIHSNQNCHHHLVMTMEGIVLNYMLHIVEFSSISSHNLVSMFVHCYFVPLHHAELIFDTSHQYIVQTCSELQRNQFSY